MSVALDALMTEGNGTSVQYNTSAASSLSSTGMTVGSSATLLVAIVELSEGGTTLATAIGCTWNGVAMNQAVLSNYTNTDTNQCVIFTLTSANGLVSGNKTLAASWSSSLMGCYLSALSFTGTDTVTGYKSADNVASGSSATGTNSIAVNTTSTEATLVAISNNGPGVQTASNQTQIFSSGGSIPNGCASYALGGSGTNTHSFTTSAATVRSWAGIHILAAATTSSGLLLSSNQGGF